MSAGGFCRCGKKHYVFVYGTLKRNQPNHHLLEKAIAAGNAKFVGSGKTAHKFPLVIATRYNIPFMLPCAGNGQVKRLANYRVMLESYNT